MTNTKRIGVAVVVSREVAEADERDRLKLTELLARYSQGPDLVARIVERHYASEPCS